MDRNQHVLGTAFKKARGKRRAILRLGVTPDMEEAQIEALVTDLAQAKAIEANQPIDEFLDGQQWYVESLVAFSAMTAAEQLNYEYEMEFPHLASEDEMLLSLEAIA